MKKAFLLLGAQRSGTSVTSHMLSKFGIDFGNPERFLQAAHNPIFFELKWINQYNDRLLQRLGYKYTDCFLPVEADYIPDRMGDLEQELPTLLQQEWGDATTIGIKDPRISLTFPVWQRVLASQGFSLNIVFLFRHPGDFLRSNQKLFQDWSGWNEGRHLHFWLRLTLAALYFTRDYPVCLVNYDELMAQPQTVAERLATTFNLDTTHIAAAAAVVEQTYHHYKDSTQTGYPLIDHYYNLLRTHSLSEVDYLTYRDISLASNYA
jgi:hypothetical protein